MEKILIGHCKKCKCKPCQCEQLDNARKHGSMECISCGTKLLIKGGYYGTDLCGPCCTGDSDTLDEQGIEW